MKKNEKGITLIALMITIIILIIIASIGISSGKNVIRSSKFTAFTTELKLMQSQVNAWNQKYENGDETILEIGEELTTEEQAILDTAEVSNIISQKANGDTTKIEEIKSGFRLLTENYLVEEMKIEGITNDFLINIKQRIIVSKIPFEYEDIAYYMLEQIDDGLYNVNYENQNNQTGDFTVTTRKVNDKWQIEISNIQHEKYVEKWQVKYKKQDAEYWQTSNNLIFYVEPAIYDVKVVHGNDVEMETKVAYATQISDVLKIGDYVNYNPTEGTYNPSEISEAEESTTGEIATETELQWQYLGTDENGNAMLISAEPTEATIELTGADGYNYGVNIIDEACETLYNSSLAKEVRNLKIEDIEDRLTETVKNSSNVYGYTCTDGTKYGEQIEEPYTTNAQYPYLYEKEIGGKIGDEATTGELDLSDKGTPTQAGANTENTSLTVTQTYWYKAMSEADFISTETETSYYKMFINNESNYQTYWMSSRCVSTNSDGCYFRVRFVGSGSVDQYALFGSYGDTVSRSCAFRPIIILKSNVQIDNTNYETGKDANGIWQICIK